MSADENDDDFDDVPLQHKRPFGSGLRRNEIKFVPATDEDTEAANQQREKSKGQSISDLYLSMVLKKPETAGTHKEPAKHPVCDICSMPLNTPDDNASSGGSTSSRRPAGPHEASIAHQVCLAHSHPPSALDRSRMGLSVLAAQGWDPDSRAGLGAAGQGTQYPVRARPKEDRLGVGVVVPKDGATKKKEKEKEKERPRLLDAKKVRKMAAEDRKRADKLQREIFGRVDLERYLGPAA
ncbi:putative g-patch domain-containing protein [Diaporthe ampelina]|uniref:Putative g-patch domain-containing protein n=1 Tax=Diaporthe ampelina TaxID=1214573 RepID=A0A0G2FHM8_9PEZI|nr:putative g-patch domain-containing protein [Diaporthe ampelina]